MQRYAECNASPSTWLGDLPSHWECKKIGALFTERKTKASDKDYVPLSVTKMGILPQLEHAAKTNDGDNRKLVCAGDFVINSRSDRKGSCGVSELDGSVSLINLVLTPRGQWNNCYVHYLLRSQPFSEEYYRNGRGIVDDLWTTRYSEMKSILLPVPPRDEQDQIVRFLDWKVSSINKLIGIKRKQIAQLVEMKKNSIHNAVTGKWSDTNEFIDSGFDFIGQIPAYWQIFKLKRLLSASLQYGANATGIEFDESLPRYIRITDITLDNKLKDTARQSLPTEVAQPYILEENDLLFARSGATVGKSFIYKKEYGAAAYAGYLIRAKVNTRKALPEYVYAVTLSKFYELWKDRIFIQATIQNISADKYNNLPVPLPPLKEQEEIVRIVAEKTQAIETAIDKTKQYVKELVAFKDCLISDAVTGKIDVRGIEIPEYDFVDENADSDAEDADSEEETEEQEE